MMNIFILLFVAGLCHTCLAFSLEKAQRQCGIPAIKPDTSTNIVGGKDAIPYSWPWQISLLRDGKHVCGGALISNEWIMTAAHCADSRYPEVYEIKLGVFLNTPPDSSTTPNENNQIGEDGEIISTVTEIYVHPNFNLGESRNDIALLKLSNPVKFTDHISPICLPTVQNEELPPVGTNLFSTGWGRVVDDNTWKLSRTLKQVMLPLMSTELCKARNAERPRFDEIIHICAGFDQGGKGICHGDSGGAAVFQTGDGTWKQIGINSFIHVDKCATPSGSGFTKVSAMMDFVKKYVTDLP